MDGAPGTLPDPVTQQARDRDRDHELERDRAQPEPERAVVRAEGHGGSDDTEMCERVHHRGDDVECEKHERHQGQLAMQRSAQEARPAAAFDPQPGHESEDDDAAEQHE